MSLANILNSAGIRQMDLAQAIGARPETISRWVNGHNAPVSVTAAQVLSFLNRPEHLKKLGRRKPLTFEEVFGAGEAQAEPARKAS